MAEDKKEQPEAIRLDFLKGDAKKAADPLAKRENGRSGATPHGRCSGVKQSARKADGRDRGSI